MNALIGHPVDEKLYAKMHLGHSDVPAQMDCLSIVQREVAQVVWYAAIMITVPGTRFALTELVTVLNQMLVLIVKVNIAHFLRC